MIIAIQVIDREGKPPHHIEVVDWVYHHNAIHQVTVLKVAERSLAKYILELITKSFTNHGAVTITEIFS